MFKLRIRKSGERILNILAKSRHSICINEQPSLNAIPTKCDWPIAQQLFSIMISCGGVSCGIGKWCSIVHWLRAEITAATVIFLDGSRNYDHVEYQSRCQWRSIYDEPWTYKTSDHRSYTDYQPNQLQAFTSLTQQLQVFSDCNSSFLPSCHLPPQLP